MSFRETLTSAGVDARSIETFVEQRSLQVGEYLIRQGEFNRNIYKLTDGLIKLMYVTEWGLLLYQILH